MGKFNPTQDPIISSGKISASRGIEPNRALEELFSGLGRTLGNVSNAWEQSNRTQISLDANSAVENVVQQRLANVSISPDATIEQDNQIRLEQQQARSNPTITNPTDLPGMSAAMNDLKRYKAASDAGKMPTSHYYALLAKTRKDMVAAHPGFADVVDGALSSAIGSNIGWDLANQIESEQAREASSIDSQIKFNRQYAKDNEDIIGAAVGQGLLPDANYLDGDFDVNAVGKVVSRLKANDYIRDSKRKAAELDEKLAGPAAQEAINNYTNSVFSASNKSMKDFFSMESEILKDNQVTPDEKAKITASINILKREMPIGARSVLDQYPKLSPDQRKSMLAQVDERLKDIEEFWNNPDFGVLKAEERHMADVLLGEQSKIMEFGPAKSYLALLKLGFPADVASMAMPSISQAIRDNLLLKEGTNLRDQQGVLTSEGKSKADISKAMVDGIKGAISAISNPATPEDSINTAVTNLFGSKDAVDFLGRYVSENDRIEVFSMLVNPVVTNRLKGTKYWGAYSAFALKQFSAVTMPLVNEERRRKQLEDSSYQVTYDPKTNHFVSSTNVPTSTLNSGTPRLVLEQLGFIDRGVDRINKYIDLVSPIIKENGGDVTSWLQNAIVRDFNDVQHTGGILELMYNALKDSATDAANTIENTIKGAVGSPQGPENRGTGKGQGSKGGGGYGDEGVGGYAPGENPFQPGSDLNPDQSSSVESSARLVASFEGLITKAKYDVNHYRVGYGSDTYTDANGNIHAVTKDTRISKNDALRDLARRIPEFQTKIISKIGEAIWNRLSPEAHAALTSVTYNYGDMPSGLAKAVKSGDEEAILNAWRRLEPHNGGINRKRRRKEALIFLSSN